MAKQRPKATSSRRAKPAKKPDRVVGLSISAGDPLQPAGLSEYLAARDRPRSAGGRQPAADAAPKPDRAAALKSAHARWMKRTKPK